MRCFMGFLDIKSGLSIDQLSPSVHDWSRQSLIIYRHCKWHTVSMLITLELFDPDVAVFDVAGCFLMGVL
jgi:hypothetical protein